MANKYILVYITASSKDEALKIGKTLLDEKLAACINVIAGMDSIYKWQGEVERAREAILLVKTRKTLFEDVKHRVGQLHSYDVPCIVSFDIQDIEGRYESWLGDNTLEDKGKK